MARTYAADCNGKISEEVTLKGWVANVRDHGGLTFIDFRDSSGVVQIVINQDESKEAHALASTFGKEWVIEVTGAVKERSADAVNPEMATGKIEIVATKLAVINASKTPPFPVDSDGRNIDENLRLKYRYIDLRRDRIANIVQLKHKYLLAVRNWMDQRNFTEVITPLLASSSPEGARDFVIPSRLHKGKAFVLPQAPQQYKQLLMVGGVDKYFQIAPCARDEDPRADRHAGVFYQIDMEMSFPTLEDIFSTAENLILDTYKVVAPHKTVADTPFLRLTHREAFEKYGSDKPDLRYGMEIVNITDIVKGATDFQVFAKADSVKCIVVEGGESFSKSQIAKLEDFAREKGAKGLAHIKVTDEGFTSGVSKFLDESLQTKITEATAAKPGDMLLFAADDSTLASKVLGQVRIKLADDLDLKDSNVLKFVWITDFPFYEETDDGKLDFGHNPFSAIKGGEEALNTVLPLELESEQYDLTLNGYELASGSIRNHDPELLVKAFEKIGYTRDDILDKFQALYEAFQYGAPPHGGWAIGVDRLLMVLMDEPNIRDTYAFPLNSSGSDPLMNSPSALSAEQLKELGIKLAS